MDGWTDEHVEGGKKRWMKGMKEASKQERKEGAPSVKVEVWSCTNNYYYFNKASAKPKLLQHSHYIIPPCMIKSFPGKLGDYNN